MTSTTHAALILGGSGRTGSLVARHLAGHGIPARTASRHGSDVFFDWDDPATYPDALAGTLRVYLVTPCCACVTQPGSPSSLTKPRRPATRHVTLLSTYNGDRAPREIDIAAAEADLAARQAFTHSILRPAWVMQNFTDDHIPVISGVLAVPSGGGSEAFVDAADIAAVAAETLLNPDAHAGNRYAPTGPQALTFGDVAAIIAAASGRPVGYKDIDQEAWISAAIAAGVPASTPSCSAGSRAPSSAATGPGPRAMSRPLPAAAGQLRSIRPAQCRCLDHPEDK